MSNCFAYEDLLADVLEKGIAKGDRTGTGTISVFGRQIRYNLEEGFPLITSKRVHYTGAVHELLWFLSGSTKTSDLNETVQKWWNPWTPESGDLGPVYGEQFRRSRWWAEVSPELFDPPVLRIRRDLFSGVGDLGEARLKTGPGGPGEPKHITMLKSTWRDVIRRCYDPRCKAYQSYGAKGVHMAEEWLHFPTFAADAMTLPGWLLKLEHPEDYSLDKDILKASNRYSKATCMWASRAEQGWNTSTNTPFNATSPDGEVVSFPSLGEMHRNYGVNISAVHRCLAGELTKHHGWTNFEYVRGASGRVLRFRELDQLRLLRASIKHEPHSRRHVINLWHSPAMQHAALPCCHGSVIQCFVNSGKLSLLVYQRSADLFIGVPVNLASYATLTHLLAKDCGLGVGELIWSGGDCHIYANHVEQVKEQLSRERRPLPFMVILDRGQDIFSTLPGDFQLEGYNPHPAIKGEVAV